MKPKRLSLYFAIAENTIIAICDTHEEAAELVYDCPNGTVHPIQIDITTNYLDKVCATDYLGEICDLGGNKDE